MNLVAIVKGVASLVTSTSAGTVISSVIKSNTPANLNRIEKVLMAVGEFVVSGVIADLSAKYVVDQIEMLTKKKDHKQNDDDFAI